MVSDMSHHFITDKAKNYLDILVKLRRFPDDQVQKLSFKILERNGYFAYSKNMLLK